MATKKDKESFSSLPNLITFIRMLIFALLIHFITHKYRELFVGFFGIAVVLNWIDDAILSTRQYGSEVGRRLDSLADLLTFIAGCMAILHFEYHYIQSFSVPMMILLFTYIFKTLFAVGKFGYIPTLRTYLSRIAGYSYSVFFFGILWAGPDPNLPYICFFLGMLGLIEEILILIFLHTLRSNVKGLLWVLNQKTPSSKDHR